MFDDILGEEIKKKEKIKDIQPKRFLNENDYYNVRLTRLYHPKPKVVFHGKTRFHIQRRPKDDTIGVLALKDIGAIPWAEYCEENRENKSVFVAEDYMMEIL